MTLPLSLRSQRCTPRLCRIGAAALAGACLGGPAPAEGPFQPPAKPPAIAQPAPENTTPQPVTITQGQSKPARPEAATRTVRLFDFEEMTTNPTLVPRYWIRAQATTVDVAEGAGRVRPGFPAWNEAELDYSAAAFRGKGSVRLPTSGGSTALLLEPGVLPVLQNADYTITAMVRTNGVKESRARLVARFLDASSTPIPESQAAGEPVVAEGQWKPTSLELVGNFDSAAFIEIELQLLQPQEQGPAQSGRAVVEQDLSGAAWFDDVAVTQLPRIELTTSAPGNVICRPQTPELRLDVRDLTGELLRAQVTVFDAYGTIVDKASRSIGSGRAREPWRPKIDKLGWYRAVLRIYNDTSLVGQASADFIWIGESDTAGGGRPGAARAAELPDRRRFGLSVGPLRGSLATELPEIVSRVSSGGVIVPVWGQLPLPPATMSDGRPPRTVIDELIESGQEVTLALDRLPEALALATRTDADDPWPVLGGSGTLWDPYLGPVLEKYGTRVRRWMIGAPGDDLAFWRPDLGADLTTIERALGRLVPGPVLGVPWRIDRAPCPEALEGSVRTLVGALVPYDSPPEQVGAYADLWRRTFKNGGPEVTLVFDSDPEDGCGYGGDLGMLVKRTVEFWQAFDGAPGPGPAARPACAALGTPWSWSDERRPKLRPSPELAVWANLIRRLSDRRVVGRFTIAEGVTGYILAPAPGAPAGRAGALVAWNDSAAPRDAVLRDYLGRGTITVVDMFGNTAPAPTEVVEAPGAEESASPRTARRTRLAVPIGADPVFIEGIDPALARFIGSVKIEPGLLSATNDNHEHALVFDNPWPSSLDLRAFIVQPGGLDASGGKDRRWKITPRSGRAIVAPGQQGRLPLTITFSPAEEAGPKTFVIDLDVTADQPYGLIRVNTAMKLGLEGFSIELSHVIADGRDVVVEAQVTNTSKTPINLELTASAPGFARAKAPVSALPPGATVVRRFPYPGALAALKGKRVSVAVSDPETKARLNRSIVIE